MCHKKNIKILDSRGHKRTSTEAFGGQDPESDEETPDEVRLYEDGFKDRYYEAKFGLPPDDPQSIAFRQRVAAEYTLGLCWVLRYYYQVIYQNKLCIYTCTMMLNANKLVG
jgi:5'-3' exoribonuclease 2